MNRCMGCLKTGKHEYCVRCRRVLFDGMKVSSSLNFSRTGYNKEKSTATKKLSISGIQTKMSLVLKNEQLAMADFGGQYILKPIPQGTFDRLEVVPINEHLTMQIAAQVFHIETAANALVKFSDGEYAYLTRRFDIQSNGKKLLQEDFAQLAGRSEETNGINYKYDYSYQEIGDLIRKHVPTFPVDLERFYKLVLFNYLVNNGDAHTKNFSVLRSESTGQYRLSPAYDLLNTCLHIPNDSRTALDLFKGDFQTPSFEANAYYAFDDFLELAKILDLKELRYRRILDEMTSKTDQIFSLIDQSFLPNDCQQLYKEQILDRQKTVKYSYGS